MRGATYPTGGSCCRGSASPFHGSALTLLAFADEAPSDLTSADEPEEEEEPAWKAARDMHTTDFGVYSQLPGQLAQEYRVTDVGKSLGSESQTYGAIRRIVEHIWTTRSQAYDDSTDLVDGGYWLRRGRLAEDYLRDMVYGGLDGFAYIRSLADFVAPTSMQDVAMGDDDMEVRP